MPDFGRVIAVAGSGHFDNCREVNAMVNGTGRCHGVFEDLVLLREDQI
jgi:hypothetical protein